MKKFILILTVMLATSMGLLAQGTSWQTATLISSGATKTGTLDNVIGEHWYKINVTTEGTVNLTLDATDSGNLLISTSGSYVAGVRDNNTYSRGNFSGSGYGVVTATYQGTDMGKGTYYIRVCRYNGAGTYSLKYTFTQCSVSNDPEPNNDYEHSSLLQSGSTVKGRLGYRTSDDVTDNEDWYKIVVPEEGHVELMATSTATATENMLLSTNASYVAGYKNGGTYSRGNISAPGYSNDTITYLATDMGKGTYYIRIARYNGCGGYRLYYKFTPCSLAADPEPNNDYEHSSLIESGSTVQGRLGHRTSDDITDSEDWYKIVVPEEGHVELIATATENLLLSTNASYVAGYKNNGTYSRGNISAPGYSNDTITYLATDMGKGTYYIRIARYNGCGGYKLYYEFTPCSLAADPEPNNDYQHSSRLVNGKITEGRLGHRTSDDVTDNEDWYRINVPKEGPIEITVTATENLMLSTYSSQVYSVNADGSLKSLGSISASGYSNAKITYSKDDMAAGYYYIRICRYSGCGGYRINYNGPAIPGDVDNDGIVDVSDIVVLIDNVLGGSTLPIDATVADMNQDGVIDIVDVVALIDLVLNG